ncbi:UNVERIFIED_CONTAM: hypothetical protein FKN15_059823 [Acipenser sinensis]
MPAGHRSGMPACTAQGCLPCATQGCLLLRIAWGCLLLCIAWGCLLLCIAWGCLVLRIAWGCLVLRIAWGCLVLCFAWGCLLLCIAWGCLLLCIAWGCLLLCIYIYRVRGRSEAPAAASMARGSPPEFASRGSAAAAVASRGSAAAAVAAQGSAAAAAVASRGSAAAAIAFRGSAAAAVDSRGSCFAWVSRGSCFTWGRRESCVAAGSTVAGAPQRGVAGHEERGEVRRPTFPAAFSRQETLWPEPHRVELPATKNGGRSGNQLLPQQFRCQKLGGQSPTERNCRPRRRGGGQETSSPSRTFAAGDSVAEAPEEEAVSHKEVEGGGHSTMATPRNTLFPPLLGL